MKRARARLASGLAAAGLAGALLTSCGGSGASALVNEACSHVTRSITLYEASTHDTGRVAASERHQALVQLRDALRPAALAGTQYQALKTTLSESSRVPEANLIGALRAQCAASGTSGTSGTP